jgi:hypothetical protein
MSGIIFCLVSRIAKPRPLVNSEMEINASVIACYADDRAQEITIADGFAPYDAGSTNAPAKILSQVGYQGFLKDGRT